METQEMSRERLNELIRQFDNAMLVTRTASGMLRARPMAIADIDEQGHIWFVTDRHTGKVADVEEREVVNVTMQGSMVFVSLTAVAEPVEDRVRIRQLWKEAWRVWFPDGPKSPGLVLLRVEPTHGEYWDNRGGKGLTYLWEAVKAYATGEQLEDGDLRRDQHGRVDL